jgi:hypothetical protein
MLSRPQRPLSSSVMPHLDTPVLLVRLAGTSMVLHFLLALIASAVLSSDKAAVSEIFLLPPFGSLVTRRPYLMRVELFLPCLPVHSVANQPASVRALVWAARLCGTAFLLCLLSIFSTIAYAAVHGA